jgi:Flp pilus assembly protein CpaB
MEIAHRVVSTRRGTILVALFAALMAGLLVLVYVNRYRDSIAAQGAPVTVLVARETIPKGTSGSVIANKALYTATTIRQSQLVDGAFSDPSSLTGKVTGAEIVRGAQLAAGSFTATKTVASTLTERQRIVSVPLDSSHGLIGQIEDGDHVDVFAGFNVVPLNADGTPVAGGQSRAVLRKILTDIPVVGVGGGKSGGLTGSGATGVELKLDDDQAANLAFASDNGKLWLALRPSAGAKSSPPSIVTMETLLLGVPPVTILRTFRGHR